MSAMASEITGASVVYSTFCSDADQTKYQSSASLAFVRGIHRWPVNSPHKGPVKRKMFQFGDVIMGYWPVSVLPRDIMVATNAHIRYECDIFVSWNAEILGRQICNGNKDTGPNDNFSWWRHPMKKVSASLVICAGNSAVADEFPAQRPVTVTRSFDVFLHLRLNKRLSKQSWGWWFETPSRPLWRHSNAQKNMRDLVYF